MAKKNDKRKDPRDNLSEIALQKFISESKRKYKPKPAEQLRELKEMDLLEYDSKKRKYSNDNFNIEKHNKNKLY